MRLRQRSKCWWNVGTALAWPCFGEAEVYVLFALVMWISTSKWPSPARPTVYWPPVFDYSDRFGCDLHVSSSQRRPAQSRGHQCRRRDATLVRGAASQFQIPATRWPPACGRAFVWRTTPIRRYVLQFSLARPSYLCFDIPHRTSPFPTCPAKWRHQSRIECAINLATAWMTPAAK